MKKLFRRLSTKRDVQQERNWHRSRNKLSWASVSSNSLPASCNNPTFQEVQRNNIQAAQQPGTLMGQPDHVQTETGISSASLQTPAPDSQATPPPPPEQPQSTAPVDTPAPQLSGREPIASGSELRPAAKLPSTLQTASQDSRSTSQQDPASIYKSYNDIDIMSSGTFDFSQHHLLSSAPDGDWLSLCEDQPSDRLPDRPKTAAERPHNHFGHPWETPSSDRPLPQHQPASKPNKVKWSIPRNPAFSSPDACARPRPPPYSGASPMAAMQGCGPPHHQPLVTPFAKYSNSAMSGPLMSTDLDSAMRQNGQIPMQSLQALSPDEQKSGTFNGSVSPNNRMPSAYQPQAATFSAQQPSLPNGNSLPGAAAVYSPRRCMPPIPPPFGSPNGHRGRPPSAVPVEGTPHPGAVATPRSSSGAPVRASQMKPQAPWNSEALSRRLEPDFSQAGPSSAVDGAPRTAPHWRHSNGYPQANGNPPSGVGVPLSNGHSRVGGGPAQPQQLGKQAEARSSQVEEAQRQVEQALQTADQQIEALKARVSRKNAQLCETKLRLEHLREDVPEGGANQRHAPASLPDTESSEQTEMAAAEMQLLRQALDKLQSETHVLDDELARSREQAIFSEFERAELSHDLELVTAQLRSCEASKAELEATIAKLLSDVQGKSCPRQFPRRLLHTESYKSQMSPRSLATDCDIPSSSSHLARSPSGLSARSNSNLLSTVASFPAALISNRSNSNLLNTMPSFPAAASSGRDVAALENELELLRAELEETKRRLESDVAKAREDALGVMRATGDADAEVRRLLGESAQLNSAQQEAEAELGQSRQTIQELQAALKSAQAAMVTDRLEREQALDTIAQLRQQQRHLHAEQDLHSPKNEAPRLTQHIAELDKRVADLALTNDELSTDLGRALDVAQRVMDQKAKLQEQCQSQEQQLLHWQAEAERVKELEGFADEALSALEAQTQENSKLRQQVAAAASATLP